MSESNNTDELEFHNLEFKSEQLLLPKHTAKFRWGLFERELIKKLSLLPESDLWISINSYEGELCQVSGREIQAVLKAPPTNQVNS